SYRWGDSRSNASLVPDEGMDEPFIIYSPSQTRTQMWHYPARSECVYCHTPFAGYALGFNSPQLNCDAVAAEGPGNQLDLLNAAGYFDAKIPSSHDSRAL